MTNFKSVKYGLTVALLFGLCHSKDIDSRDTSPDYNRLKNAATLVMSKADSEPLRRSDLPESGLYLKLINDCDTLVDNLNINAEPSTIIGNSEKVINGIESVTGKGLQLRKYYIKSSNVTYKYFNGGL